jgi:hypothetical protein
MLSSRALRAALGAAAVTTLAAMNAGLSTPARAAESVEAAYKGKTLNFIVTLAAGGGYDQYARTLARHLNRQAHPGQSQHRRAEHDWRRRDERDELAL